MSLISMAAVWENETLTSTQKLVSLYIADKVCEENQWLFYGAKTKCIKKTRLKKDTVYKVFRELECQGFITKLKSEKGQPTKYRFNIDTYLKGVQSECIGGVSQNGDRGVSQNGDRGVSQNGDTITQDKTQDKTPPLPPKRGAEEEGTISLDLSKQVDRFAQHWNYLVTEVLVKQLDLTSVRRIQPDSFELKRLVKQWIRKGKNENDFKTYLKDLMSAYLDQDNAKWLFENKERDILFANRCKFEHRNKFYSGDWSCQPPNNNINNGEL